MKKKRVATSFFRDNMHNLITERDKIKGLMCNVEVLEVYEGLETLLKEYEDLIQKHKKSIKESLRKGN